MELSDEDYARVKKSTMKKCLNMQIMGGEVQLIADSWFVIVK